MSHELTRTYIHLLSQMTGVVLLVLIDYELDHLLALKYMSYRRRVVISITDRYSGYPTPHVCPCSKFLYGGDICMVEIYVYH